MRTFVNILQNNPKKLAYETTTTHHDGSTCNGSD